MNETAKNLSKLIATFNDRHVITEVQVQEVIQAIVSILAENKKGIDSLSVATKKELERTLNEIGRDNQNILATIRADLSKSKDQIAQATKEQNDRAFQRLQTVINAIRMPKDGKDGLDGKDGAQGLPGKDGSPDTPEVVRDKLETLKDEERLDASAIKNLPKWIERKGKELIIGGIRFLENLADVSISIVDKRQDLLIQYDETDKRWEDGIALTVSTTAPSNPKVNDLWVDIS